MNDEHNLAVELVRVPETEYNLLYSNEGEDALTGCLVHIRFDFGSSGKEHWPTNFPHNKEAFTAEAREDIKEMLNTMGADSILLTRGKLAAFCWDNPDAEIGNHKGYWGFKHEGETYTYYFRFFPMAGDYNMYCYMYETAKLQEYLKNK